MKRVFICFLPLVTFSTAFSSDRLMNTEFLESLCVVKSDLEKIDVQSLLEADNRLFAKFNKDIDVPDEIIKSCMSTMANLMILEENFRYSEDSDEDAEKCAKCEGMQPYINVLEHRLFKMCLAHCRNLGSSDDPTEDANTLYEKLLDIVEAKVAKVKKK